MMNQEKIDQLLDIRDRLEPGEFSNVDLFLEKYAVGEWALSTEEREIFCHDWKMLNRVEKRIETDLSFSMETPRLLGSYWNAGEHTDVPCVMNLNLTPQTEVIPGYTLISRLGQGWFSQVWLGKGPGDIQVAMKFIPPIANDDSDLDSDNEAMEITRQVRYPHLLPIHGIWTNKEYRLIISSLADETLWDRLHAAHRNHQKGIDTQILLAWFHDIAKTLDFLNQPALVPGKKQYPILHGDIKPENIFLSGGSILVGDLGQACILKQDGQKHAGGLTFSYAAPECLNGFIHKNSDQYSLAVTWCILRGADFPYSGPTYLVMNNQAKNKPRLDFFPRKERLILKKALSYDPNNRFSSCLKFVEALDHSFAPKKYFSKVALFTLGLLVLALAIPLFWQLYYLFPSVPGTVDHASKEKVVKIEKQPFDHKIILSAQNSNFSWSGLVSAIATAEQNSGITLILLQTDSQNHQIFFPREIAIGRKLSLSKGIIIAGEGPEKPVFNAEEKSRHFFLANFNLTLRNISLQNGRSITDGSSINNGGSILCSNDKVKYHNKFLLNIEQCTFENNHASAYGGAVYNTNKYYDVHVTDSIFKNNSADQSGGAMYLQCGNRIQGSSFLKNSSKNGNGGAIVTSETCTVIQSEFNENSNDSMGGGLLLENNGNLQCEKVIFRKNSSGLGGGLAVMSGNVLLQHCGFYENSTKEFGGGIMNYKGTVTLSNSRITNNITSGGGGGIVNGYSLFLFNCLVNNNQGDREGAIDSLGRQCNVVRIINSIITGNHSKNSKFVLRTNGKLTRIHNSIIVDNKASNDTEAMVEFFGSFNTVRCSNCLVSALMVPTLGRNFKYNPDKPLFTDQTKGDYTPASKSQAIDRGDNACLYEEPIPPNVQYGKFDLADKTRIINGIIDIGAYECQMPDPSVTASNDTEELNPIGVPPKEYLKQYQETEKAIKQKDGMYAIAGQILYDKKSPAQTDHFTVMVYYNDWNTEETLCFENGWFITKTQFMPNFPKWNQLDVSDYTHEPKRVPIEKPQAGKIGFNVISLTTPPQNELVTYSGIIFDEDGIPLSGATVSVYLDRTNNTFRKGDPITQVITDKNGHYAINGLYPQMYDLLITKEGYGFYRFTVGFNTINHTTLHRKRQLLIDYEVSDTVDFSGKNIVKNVTWDLNTEMIFDKSEHDHVQGLRFDHNSLGQFFFHFLYSNELAGHYDTKKTSLDFVENAIENQLGSYDKKILCYPHHVYVVRTPNGKYVKFIVREMKVLKFQSE